ncbi:hypothetical protein HU200_013324 [Digitaria exilis]|uniref:F-box protein n=1 Tax=Digitaria exilis TaxID=1010633 RepID=A0A835FD83_9POAL|nr:hypothetical protein HU200_013324 [Digitaria exilis]
MDLLPEDVLADHDNCWSAFLLRRPSPSAAVVSADLDYTFPGATDDEIYSHEAFVARDHCNGLLLVDDRVVNPATRQWARLPPRPPPSIVGPTGHYYFYSDVYLAYDPAVSPHYEVFAVPRVRRKQGLYNGDQMMSEKESPFLYSELDPAVEELQWPPSPCVLHVFSSRTGRWEKRSFVRRGAAAARTVADMRIDQFIWHRHAVYWGGALYVHCQTDFIMRLSLSSQEYQLIQPPVPFKPDSRSRSVESYARRLSIGKSEKGVYSVLVEQSQIKVWMLDETNGQFMWVSKQLDYHLPKLQDRSFLLSQLESHGPWVLQAISSHYYTGPDAGFQTAEPDQFEWDSDNNNILPENGNTTGYKKFITFIGFHPFKEVIFLNDSLDGKSASLSFE